MAPPLYSTFSAVTELVITAAVVWFFYSALKHGKYRWGIIGGALFYETMFNITYMVSRLFGPSAADHEYPLWFAVFLGFHGLLSLVMFIGLIAIVIWAFDQRGKHNPHPLDGIRPLTYVFLVLWGISITTGELIYLAQWTDIATL